MRRWNGWGDDSIKLALNAEALAFLQQRIGQARLFQDATLADTCRNIAPGRLPPHCLIDTAPETRLRCGLGQSLPDWLKLRYGRIAATWSNHTLGAWPALAAMREINAAPVIRVESLGAFLATEARGLEQLLQREEAWARANVPLYPPRPEALAFRPGGTPAGIIRRAVVPANCAVETPEQRLPAARGPDRAQCAAIS